MSDKDCDSSIRDLTSVQHDSDISPKSGPVSPCAVKAIISSTSIQESNNVVDTKDLADKQKIKKRKRNNTGMVIGKKSFRKIVLDISESFAKPEQHNGRRRKHLLKFDSEAISALQCAAEEIIISLFHHASKIQEARDAKQLCKIDLETARYINPALYRF